MKIITLFEEARKFLNQGKIIAYPTEAVYGLGCDPFNRQAVEKLLAIKHREAETGFIILIANWSQLTSLITPIPDELLSQVRNTWPGPVTWIFPKSVTVPDWLSNDKNTIAIRMSAHPVAQALCAKKPVISTSANLSGHTPARDRCSLSMQFPEGIDGVVVGELGSASQPSTIYEVLTGKRLR